MKIIESNSAERFDNTSFSNVVVGGKVLPLDSTYTCPKCGKELDFTKTSIQERSQLKISKLSKEYQLAFDNYAYQHLLNNLFFLDWCCAKCKTPTRVYVKHWTGGRRGDSGLDIVTVLETAE